MAWLAIQIALVLIALLLMPVLLIWLCREAIRSEPQYYVQARGPATPPSCPGCGYNLYYAKDQRCPECGRPFETRELGMRLATWDGQVLRPRQPEDKT
jgi:predicted amidophosphoribosyltransferase